MGIRNYLIDGGSGTGKTAVATELERRGYQVFHGDRMLAYQGDPETGAPVDGSGHEHDAQFISDHHIWDVGRVRALAADSTEAMSFFCGGSRNAHRFIDLFDKVFVLEIDLDTLSQRLDGRSGEWGSTASERELIVRLHMTGEGIPKGGIGIDATQPIPRVVDEILSHCGQR